MTREMKVAIDTSPTKNDHRFRGIGSFTLNLVSALKGISQDLEIELFDNSASAPDADIIHYPYFDLFFHTLPIKKKAKRVVTIHDVIPLVFPNYFPVGLKGFISLFFQKWALKNVDAVICDSKASACDIAQRLSFPKDKIHVIYLAAGFNFRPLDDQKLLLDVKTKYNLPKKFILYVGDVNWNKNIDNLLAAVTLAKVNLVMVGAALVNKSLRETRQIEKIIKKLGLSPKIIRTGFVPEEDLIALYNLADLTVLPSFYEGFGLPVIESMACGTPVVCSSKGSLVEIAGPAFICDPTNPEDVSEKFNSVIKLSTIKRKKIETKCLEHAAKFTWQKVAAETIKVYQSLLNAQADKI